jgi:hypothetical protein
MPKLLGATTENLVGWAYRHLGFVFPFTYVRKREPHILWFFGICKFGV